MLFRSLKASLANITSVIGKRPPEEPPFRRYAYGERIGAADEMPYQVAYPREDNAFNLAKQRMHNETILMDKIAELVASENPTQEDKVLAAEARDVLGNLEAIGNLAKLVDKLGDTVGLAKGWMKWEVLKSLQN